MEWRDQTLNFMHATWPIASAWEPLLTRLTCPLPAANHQKLLWPVPRQLSLSLPFLWKQLSLPVKNEGDLSYHECQGQECFLSVVCSSTDCVLICKIAICNICPKATSTFQTLQLEFRFQIIAFCLIFLGRVWAHLFHVSHPAPYCWVKRTTPVSPSESMGLAQWSILRGEDPAVQRLWANPLVFRLK